MRYLRYAFLALLAVGLVTVAMANRAPVTLKLLTDDMAALVGVQNAITLPLFVVIFGGIVAGVLIGFIWEWFREHKHRAEASANRRDKEHLQREVSRLRDKGSEAQDDVLALLDGPNANR